MKEADLVAHYGITAAELQAGCLVDPNKVSGSRRVQIRKPSPEVAEELRWFYTHLAHVTCGDMSKARFDAVMASERRLVALQMADAA